MTSSIRKTLKVIAWLIFVMIVYIALWAVSLFSPTGGRIAGPIVGGITFPVHAAVQYDLPFAVKILAFGPLKDQAMPHLKGGCHTPIQAAVRKGSIEMVKILLDRNANLEKCSGATLIHTAVGQPEILEYLITERKMDADARRTPDQESAIFTAVVRCMPEEDKAEGESVHLRSTRVLLDHGANPNQTSPVKHQKARFGNPPPLLAVAAIGRCTNQVALLLERGADPIAAAEVLRGYYSRKAPLDEEAHYEFQTDDASPAVQANIRLIKRAAEARKALP